MAIELLPENFQNLARTCIRGLVDIIIVHKGGIKAFFNAKIESPFPFEYDSDIRAIMSTTLANTLIHASKISTGRGLRLPKEAGDDSHEFFMQIVDDVLREMEKITLILPPQDQPSLASPTMIPP